MNARLREISSGWNKLRIEHNFEVASYKQNYSSTKNIKTDSMRARKQVLYN